MQTILNEQSQENMIEGLMAEIEMLRQENLELRMDNELLHNMMEQKYEESLQEEDLSYIDEYAKGNSEWENISLPEGLDWRYEG